MCPIEAGHEVPGEMPADLSKNRTECHDDEWKTIGWDGLLIPVPQAFEIDVIGRDYLVLGESSGPVLEIKRSRSIRRASPEILVRRFVAGAEKKLSLAIAERPAPESFNVLDPCFTGFYFDWKGATGFGRGILLFCRQCRSLTMIRFLKAPKQGSGDLENALLSGFLDHPAEGVTRWSIYGFAFSMPTMLALHRYSFQPGALELIFKGQGHSVTRYSWGPASFLLERTTLENFSASRIQGLTPRADLSVYDDGTRLVWKFERSHRWSWLLPDVCCSGNYGVATLTHDRKANRIYSAVILSRRRIMVDDQGIPETDDGFRYDS